MQLRLDFASISDMRFRPCPAYHFLARYALRILLCTLFIPPALTWAAADWSDDILYFVLIDRYADGDSTNNRKVERGNPGGFHGGDLKGLTLHLDELADLGITALWINPVQKQITQSFYASAPANLGILSSGTVVSTVTGLMTSLRWSRSLALSMT